MNYAQVFSLSNKVAIVTGCNKGIGRAIAEGFAQAGADIIGVSSSLLLENSAIQQRVESYGRSFYPYQVDLSNRTSLYTFLNDIKVHFERIDILVNNAGIIRRSPLEFYPDADWDQVLALNLDAPFLLSREIGKRMLTQGGGKIIFIASLLSFQGGIFAPAYTASKSAIAGLIKAFANEWASHNIHVNGIAPGYIETDNTAALRSDKTRTQSILERIPAGRWGTPEDLIGPAIFLASDASNYIHGTLLTVDGGWMGR